MTQEELIEAFEKAKKKRESLSGEELKKYEEELDNGVIAACPNDEEDICLNSLDFTRDRLIPEKP